MNGHVGPDQITGAGLADPAVAAVVDKISVREDPRISAMFPMHRCSQIRVMLTDGRVIETGDVHARGGPEALMPSDEVEAKFHVMAACLPEERRGAIWAMRARLLAPDATFKELLDLIHGAP